MLNRNFNSGEMPGITDEEVIDLLGHDERVAAVLMSRYAKIIWTKASIMAASPIDAEDLYQEGMLGLLKAISAFDKSKNVKFSTFAEVCINNKMKTALKKSSRSIASAEELSCDEDVVSENPESIYISKESMKEFNLRMSELLSRRECEIFRMFLRGSTYEQMASQLGISNKSVDNAMQRVRRKLKSVWRADHFNGG